MCTETIIKDGVAGWRGNLGWVSPGVPNSTSIVAVHSLLPEGIEIMIYNLGITAITAEQADAALAKLEEAVTRLAFGGAQYIDIGGAPLVCSKGFGFDKEIIKRMEDIAKVPVTTDLTAVVDALNTLKLKRVVMVSPLTDEMNGKIKKFIEDSGFEVVNLKSLNIQYNRDIKALPHSAAYSFAKQAYQEASGADGIYIPCGAWCLPWVVDCLEKDLGVPVIHSRQASTWAGLKFLGIKQPVRHWGKIFGTLYQ